MYIVLDSASLNYNIIVGIQHNVLNTFISGIHICVLIPCLWAYLSFILPIIVVTAVTVVTWLIWEVISVVLMFENSNSVSYLFF